MVLNDAFHNPKPQAGAFFSLGGDKRLENRPYHLRGNAGTGIGDQNPHPSMEIILPRNMAGANHQFASIGHGILGVDDQVREHLADLVGSDDCVRQSTQIRLDFHVGALELAGQQQQGIFDDGIHVDRLDLFGVAVQAEHLAHDAGNALRL